ncbi:MAG: helical membrane plugin domain-containing protein [Acidiferrobacter sp.]
MSAPIDYRHVPMPEAAAEKELLELLEALSRQGILRFLTALIGALPDAGLIVARGLNSQESRHAVQNIVTLLRTLGHVPAQDFSRFMEAVSVATQGVERETETPHDGISDPPGITGVYRLLQDDALWRALGPLLGGLKTFGESLAQGAPSKAPPPREPLL